MRISVIAAVATNGVIGRGGKLPWHLSEDLKRFKRLTMGHNVIMGRRTWEAIGHHEVERLARDRLPQAMERGRPRTGRDAQPARRAVPARPHAGFEDVRPRSDVARDDDPQRELAAAPCLDAPDRDAAQPPDGNWGLGRRSSVMMTKT